MAREAQNVSSIPEEVREQIRRAYVPGVVGMKSIAKRFGVSVTSVRRIVDPTYLERSRAMSREAKRRRTGVCRECGGETRYNGHRKVVSDLCAACNSSLSVGGKLAVMVRKMTDTELRAAKEAIIGSPKNAGYRARRLNMGESLALAALMAEEARRVRA